MCCGALSAAQSKSKPFLYIVGGRFRQWTLRNCERLLLNPLACSWEVIQPLNENRGSLGLAACGPKLLAVAGSGLHSNLSSCEVLDLHVESQSPWEAGPELRSQARHALSVCVKGDTEVFAVGGWMHGVEGSTAVESCQLSMSNRDFSSWQRRAPMSRARRLHGSAFIGDKLFTFGGCLGHEHGQWTTSSVECYDPNLDCWYDVGCMPGAGPVSVVSVQQQSAVLILHGKPAGEPNFFSFDPFSGGALFQQLKPLPLPSWNGMCASAFGTDVYVVGGRSGGKWTKTAWRYCTLTDNWYQLPSATISRRRAAAAIALVQATE